MHLVDGQQLVACDVIDAGLDHGITKVISPVLDKALKLADDLIAQHLHTSGADLRLCSG